MNPNPLLTASASGRSRRRERHFASRFTDALLIVGSVALSLWLGAVAARLALPPSDRGGLARQAPSAADAAPAPCHCLSRDASVQRSLPRSQQEGEANSEQLARRRITNLGMPPGYTSFESTFVGQLPTAARQDRQTFLQVASIQIHAPASAFPGPTSSSPGPGFEDSHPHGVD